jgi:hypothetical protein
MNEENIKKMTDAQLETAALRCEDPDDLAEMWDYASCVKAEFDARAADKQRQAVCR